MYTNMRCRHPDVADKSANAEEQDSCTHQRLVDTNMAITYLPGCIFLVKACVILLFLTCIGQLCVHEHNNQSLVVSNNSTFQMQGGIMPMIKGGQIPAGIAGCSVTWRMLSLCCLVLYADNLLYNESVFDGNGLLWTIVFAFFLNQVRIIFSAFDW